MEGETCDFQMFNEHLLWIENLVADFLPEIVPIKNLRSQSAQQ